MMLQPKNVFTLPQGYVSGPEGEVASPVDCTAVGFEGGGCFSGVSGESISGVVDVSGVFDAVSPGAAA